MFVFELSGPKLVSIPNFSSISLQMADFSHSFSAKSYRGTFFNFVAMATAQNSTNWFDLSRGWGVTCICCNTGMCHYFGYFFGVAPGFLGTFLAIPRFLGIIFLAIPGFLGIIFWSNLISFGIIQILGY